jgi:hypothetical protein
MGEELSKKRALLRLHFWHLSGFVLVNRHEFSHLAGVSILENPVRFSRSTPRAVTFGRESVGIMSMIMRRCLT